ncbi:hypothetical protein HHK36_026517 [Tetracentron sinense]|uniref:Phytochrome A-associated F-box protein n=1 Tax=Tetracentron sinense TaxID=13715 RepID=A0A834YJT3_TETSI|nr:hypothetical protein HHK36_026517 [Tetracentron sinense]
MPISRLMTETSFSCLSDDVVLKIFLKLEDDPRNWARLACVSIKFSSLIRNICWKNKCSKTIPSIVADLISVPTALSDLPGGWAALYKLAVCCPGLLRAGVLLENSDFGLEREIGPDENYRATGSTRFVGAAVTASSSSRDGSSESSAANSNCSWSLFDDLYFDTVYDVSESQEGITVAEEEEVEEDEDEDEEEEKAVVKVGRDFSVCKKRRKLCRAVEAHLASGVWNLSREQGNKLLASRFRGDCLYICDWPGCVHTEEKRDYMLFRGIFKNFKRSRVWRTINDANRSKIALDCAFCSCRETWDMHSAFCLRRVYGYHDDGEPVVRAYVCENGHVSGAWTDRPMFT